MKQFLKTTGLILWGVLYSTAGGLLALTALALIYGTWVAVVLGICWLLPTVWGIFKS